MARVQPSRCVLALVLAACAMVCYAQRNAFTSATARTVIPSSGNTTMEYSAEWRLMRAGTARLAFTPPADAAPASWQADLHLWTTGFVSKLYKVDNRYSVLFNEVFCASSSRMLASESKKRRETQVTFNQTPGKASLLERNLVNDQVLSTREIDVPPCVQDVLAGLARLRAMAPEPGQTVQLPISDGKKSASARVDALERETVKTPAGTFQTVRYEAFLFNDVLYRRKGRLFVWLTDDERRLPVQIRIQLPFYIGTVTLKLEKEDKS